MNFDTLDQLVIAIADNNPTGTIVAANQMGITSTDVHSITAEMIKLLNQGDSELVKTILRSVPFIDKGVEPFSIWVRNNAVPNNTPGVPKSTNTWGVIGSVLNIVGDVMTGSYGQEQEPPKEPEKSWFEDNWKMIAGVGLAVVVISVGIYYYSASGSTK